MKLSNQTSAEVEASARSCSPLPISESVAALSIDSLILILDSRYPKHATGAHGWSFYRTATDLWLFMTSPKDSSLRQEITDVSLESLLRRAASLPEPLPVYPCRPANPYTVEPVRATNTSSRQWSLINYGGLYATRKAAMAGGEFWQHQMRKDQDAWDKDFGPLTYGKVVGKDFEWRKP